MAVLRVGTLSAILSPEPQLLQNRVAVEKLDISEIGANLTEEPLRHRLLFAIGLQFLGNFLFVQSLEKKKVGDLLKNLERVGDTARPESIPDLIDLTANFAGKHR